MQPPLANRLAKDPRFWLAMLIVCVPPVVVMIGTVGLCMGAVGADEARTNTVLSIVLPIVRLANAYFVGLSLLVAGLFTLPIGRRQDSVAGAIVLVVTAVVVDGICWFVSTMFCVFIAMSF